MRMPRTCKVLLDQGHEKFGNTRGMQCMMNSLISICFSTIKKISCWKFWDLDQILEHGNASFPELNLTWPIAVNELPSTVNLSDCAVGISLLQKFDGISSDFEYFSSQCNTEMKLAGNGLIFTTAGHSFSVICKGWSSPNWTSVYRFWGLLIWSHKLSGPAVKNKVVYI